VREVAEDTYEKALQRVKATTKHAKLVPIDGHPLKERTSIRDKSGICHQLANEDRLIWIRE